MGFVKGADVLEHSLFKLMVPVMSLHSLSHFFSGQSFHTEILNLNANNMLTMPSEIGDLSELGYLFVIDTDIHFGIHISSGVFIIILCRHFRLRLAN